MDIGNRQPNRQHHLDSYTHGSVTEVLDATGQVGMGAQLDANVGRGVWVETGWWVLLLPSAYLFCTRHTITCSHTHTLISFYGALRENLQLYHIHFHMTFYEHLLLFRLFHINFYRILAYK